MVRIELYGNVHTAPRTDTVAILTVSVSVSVNIPFGG